ncbi:hypothetical protein KOY48_02080 [Candidatus Minimicrobia naudis]|uniref:Uncharacterized protein n=1 Tax=Candidatus Minimicrobia naudis TaxID=2841263 RepID=A0A8F1MBV9_9BACT|nr:hypothetical protein KOY48_02080 [Candidatus Minimicrobia naudis]
MYYERYYAGDIAAKNREISRLTKENRKYPTPGSLALMSLWTRKRLAIKELRSQIQQKDS